MEVIARDDAAGDRGRDRVARACGSRPRGLVDREGATCGEQLPLGCAAARRTIERGRSIRRAHNKKRMRECSSMLALLRVVQVGGDQAYISLE